MNRIKFALFSDLHYDHIHDGEERINNFINNIKHSDIDFIIQLGDFCAPKEENKFLLKKFQGLGKAFYHVMGNHDSDLFPREQVKEFFKMENTYYSFKYDKVKFIVLDTCYIKNHTSYEPYFKRNYNKDEGLYPILPDFQFKWLKEQLNDDSEYYVIFSHHSLENNFGKRGVYNRSEIRELINKVNAMGKKVLLCINGHDHGDSIEKIGETYYFGVNSMSYIWCGPEYEHFCYNDEIHQRFPFLKDLVLYEHGLYAIVIMDENGRFEIEGMSSHYQKASPKELGLGEVWNGRSILPSISSLTID